MLTINKSERLNLLGRILWDYNLSVEEADDVLQGHKDSVGHYKRESLFLKIIESYPWFTVIQLLPPEEVKQLLTRHTIAQIRSISLRHKYEFVRKRLHRALPTSG
ncbi:MAG: hypothetical protein A2X11_09345 [Bacteroidetes bacterium GWE2_42_24]|nr:MAG: hypothetical protein A2X11_09345 [Bacteroidetes bacterium GWE2_42_24]OFY31179.1 MAG: hypothetical protein A2X09_14695 [Bacteroidetes bacterium GWF2_43_11]